ncbi:unnamed protein product [Brassica rapa]|uniref:Uncharacterized protein n=1 Tax=Brassica campestris TaxID=3711 RepID=A0A3P6ADX2_BRACM|nr:unnamed protein product [Brassica rapa]VDC82498.1 unnamed protein product [Brassica rapa]
MANRNFIPPPTLMEAFVDELDGEPADDHRGLLGGRMVILSGYSVGIKYGDYSDDECDEADEDEVASVSKGDRIRKVEKRAFAKRGSIHCKHGLRF